MKYLVFSIPLIFFLILWAWGEVRIYRRGGDVYEWTKKLSKFLG